MDSETPIDAGSGGIETSAGGDLVVCEDESNKEPYEGMVFESEEAARAFYDEYAGRVGFVTRVLSSRKSERDGSIISRGLGCRDRDSQKTEETIAKQKRDKRREGCTAMILVKRERPGRWVVRKFVRDHTHSLVISLPKRRSTFDEKDKRIQELTAELRVKKRLSAAYREQLLTIMKDVEGHNEHLSLKLQVVHKNLKDLEAKRQESLHHK
ncbi:hypothetical protein LguiA_002908 [Lonicera macranthoides]